LLAEYVIPAIIKHLRQPDWCLVIVAIVTACLVFWQSFQTQRAAKASKQAAIAAKEQTQHMAASERPWLLIEIENERTGGYPIITCRAVNNGKTPAEIVDAFAKHSRTSLNKTLPDEPEHEYREGLGMERKTPHHSWIAPSKTFHVFQYDTSQLGAAEPECWEAILDGKVHLYFLGYIRYRDTFSNDTHESRFCYRYGYSSKGEPGLYMAGPAGYNKLT
jgi:hypothetical protein